MKQIRKETRKKHLSIRITNAEYNNLVLLYDKGKKPNLSNTIRTLIYDKTIIKNVA
jgi:hypothetical protein